MFRMQINTAKAAFALLIVMSNIYAMEDEPSFQALHKQYTSFLGQWESKESFKTPVNAFKDIAEPVIGIADRSVIDIADGSAKHDHITNGSVFGRSFTRKNNSALNYVCELLTGAKKSLTEDQITSGLAHIRLADVGCGLGLSAVYLVYLLAYHYELEKWQLAKPIEIDLYDVKEEHQPALSALADLIHLAYPQYFKVTTSVHDITKPFPMKGHYKIVLNLNVIHYIPSDKWPIVLNNMSDVLQPSGMILLIADHFCAGAMGISTVQQQLLTTGKEKTFFLPSLTLYSKQMGVERGTNIINYMGIPLFEESKFFPGETYGQDVVNSEALTKILKEHMDLTGSVTIGMSDSQSSMVEQDLHLIMTRFSARELFVYVGAYGFDNDSLERAIFSALDKENPPLKKMPLIWPDKFEYKYAASGITLVKL